MHGWRTTTTLVVLIAALSSRAEAQVQNLTALRQSIAQAGGRVIVTLKSTRPGAAIRAPGSPPLAADELNSVQTRLQADYPVQVQTQIPLIGALVATMSDADVARLAADPNVLAIEPDVKTYLTNAMASATVGARPARVRVDVIPWGVSTIGAPAAWASGLTGSGVKVGIMDTGIDIAHPDLNVVGGYDFTTSSSAPSAYNDNFVSCDGHGTHVAGTVAAKQNGSGVVGVAPNASLYALKVFTDFGSGCFAFLSAQIIGLQWAVTNGLDVVSISIGNSYSVGYATAVANANAAGVVVVAAAGNSGSPGITYPAAAPGTIAVAALDGANSVAAYSSSGPEMWIAAPGTSIESTLPGGGTGFKSGTSMATPHVTGVVALMRQANPTWTVAQIAAALKSGASDVSPAGFDNASGWGMVHAPVAGAATPVSMTVTPSTRAVSAQQGNAAPGDNAAVTLAGTNGGSTAWTATKRKSWTTLTTASGTGSGTVAWSRNTTGLAVGTYVDTITVSTAVTPALTIFDTLKITTPPIPVTLVVSPVVRSSSVQQGNAAASDNATVTLAGTNANTTGWTATKKKAWLTLTTASGIGTGTVAWSRNATGLAVGVYVDTITVSTAVTGSVTVFDTLHVTAAPIPVTLAVNPTARSVSVQQGSAAPSDNATVTLAGTNANTTAWSAVKKKAWLTLTTAAGTGTGAVSWTRNASGLSAGTYVDTITVSTAVTGSVTVFDTLKITAAPIPVALAVSPAARAVTVQVGTAATGDNAAVTLTGTNANTTAWSATKKQSWLTLTTAAGTGSGTVAWTRNTAGLVVGTYVDTITISTAVTGPVTLFDTLRITAAPVPITIALNPVARAVTVQQGNAAPGDNAAITLSGTNAGTTAWTATKKKAWLTLTASSGTGSGSVAWTRNASGLAVGMYVDTVTVATAVTAPVTVFDTLTITAAPVPITIALNPAARSVAAQQGNTSSSDNATVTLSGTNAGTTAWTATKKKAWLTLTTSTGTGSGMVAWTRNTTGLAVGTYVDTITVSTAVTGAVTLFDTLRITAALAPVTIALSPAARVVSVQQGNTAPGDNATVTLTGSNASNTHWTATKKQPWLTLTSGSGTGSGTLAWTRNTTGLAVGTYVDTITVTTAVTAAVTLVDTLRITAAPVPVTVAVSPAARNVSVQQGTAAPGDNAMVTLAGSGAAGTAWSATKTQGWLTFTNSSGIGSGTVAWSRSAAGLAVGVYVDTITVSTAVTAPATIYDTLRVTAPPVPVTVAVSPPVQMVSAQLGAPLADGNAVVTLSGTDASAAAWSASRQKPWTTLSIGSGTGNGALTWTRSTAGLAIGVYVDTIAVTVAGSGSSARVIDTIRILPVASMIALTPNTTTTRAPVLPPGMHLLGPAADSARVEAQAFDTPGPAAWIASVTSDRLLLRTASGVANGYVKWSRTAQTLQPGIYVDTVVVSLQSDLSVRAYFLDSLEVVAVAVPTPDLAVGDLFEHNALNADQRVALDRQGNGNGYYDLGDFLAWVNRSHIQLSAATALRLKQLQQPPGGKP